MDFVEKCDRSEDVLGNIKTFVVMLLFATIIITNMILIYIILKKFRYIYEIEVDSKDGVKIVLNHGGILPKRKTKGAAGYDIFSPIKCRIRGNETIKINTKLCMEIPDGYFGDIRSRSSLVSQGITCSGVIDSDYRGEIYVISHNTRDSFFEIPEGASIAQIIFQKYKEPELHISKYLSETERGSGGFGSTDEKKE